MTSFDLKIIPTNGERMVLLAESTFGEVVTYADEAFFRKMVDKSQELRAIYNISINRDKSFQKEVEDATEEFGNELFKGVFREDILNLFHRTIGGSINGQIDLRLMLGRPGLNSIQWEIMHFRGEYIGSRHNLVRHPFVPSPIKKPVNNRDRLRVFVVSVDPLYPQLIGEEHLSTVNMLRGFGDSIELIELFQEMATVENIKEVLFGGVDIWHFAGHGYFNERSPQDSSLIVWGEGSENYGRLSIRLLNTLAMNQSLGFCFLNACSTGQGAEREKETELWEKKDNFVNMAHSLIEGGVPVVLATNHAITTNAARCLSKRFYASVLKYGKRIDQAVRDARADLYIAAGEELFFSDWSCPALYARSRYMGLGTENLQWEQPLDIYSIRNVRKSSLRVEDSFNGTENIQTRNSYATLEYD